MHESKTLKLDGGQEATYPYQGEAKCGGSDITGMTLSINVFPHYYKQKRT
jgi:hypothetical protein